jgi:hypothetical protein
MKPPNLAGILGERRFRFVQNEFNPHGEGTGLLVGLKGGN